MFARFRRRPTPAMASGTIAGPTTVGDDHPKDAFFTRPLRVTELSTQVEDRGEGVRVSFVATVKDAVGRRCPEMAVHARVVGPQRDATGMGHTSMMGTVTFRMSGPRGDYRCVIEDVAGGALGLDEEASALVAAVLA